MAKELGPVLTRIFREICEESNKSKRLAEHRRISAEEIVNIEKLLKKVDQKNFNLNTELRKYFGVEIREE
ncbi:MAG: hypothetical protein HGN29_18330 [Asgard group archaeon]|nr:hypothetical protein [Asgard group archaeon]